MQKERAKIFDGIYVDYYVYRYIVVVVYKANQGVITLEMAKQMVKKRHELPLGRNLYILIKPAQGTELALDAADWLSGPEGVKGIAAAALLVPVKLDRLMGEHIAEHNKPIIGVELFDDEEEAWKWLEEMRRPNAKNVTPRQKQVLNLLPGLYQARSKEIAQRLGCKPKTVDSHIQSLKARFGVDSIDDLIDAAKRYGYISNMS